ncbi:LAME_0E01904g1_1 [Lachancea meyersii CBS 8951]|uniref:LAME_0E01904g1_1 n=1 Tax=Lachancea meyersii CBS 8951 TaxID=1266667 RepID=A0A1G4JG14_9SACH|nr:LAME_0E01904g1_1 [Lachancea meyersii CBS 8951]
MNSKNYLKSYGWKEGEGLKPGALKRPILVKHKMDKKGLGSAPGGDDGDMWWETLFDGHLKNLNVNDSGTGAIKFEKNKASSNVVVKDKSPLYKWFVKGEVLKGTIEKNAISTKIETVESSRKKRERESDESSITRKFKKSRKSVEKKQKDDETAKNRSKEHKKDSKRERSLDRKDKKDAKRKLRKDAKDRKDEKPKHKLDKKDRKDKKALEKKERSLKDSKKSKSRSKKHESKDNEFS